MGAPQLVDGPASHTTGRDRILPDMRYPIGLMAPLPAYAESIEEVIEQDCSKRLPLFDSEDPSSVCFGLG